MRARLKKAAALLLCGCMLSAFLPGAQAEVGASDDAPTIPGYTQYTASTLDPTREYLIVTQDSDGNVYALYASETGAGIGAGLLNGPQGACTAVLDLTGESPTARYLNDDTPLDMPQLHFTVTAVDKGYSLSANHYYLSLGHTETDKMFTPEEAVLSVSVKNGAYLIASSNGRKLDFNKSGVPPFENHITDFWGPTGTTDMPIYLYVKGDWTPPPPETAPGAPAGGTTEGQPFATGTGGSRNFRIPALITLSDGTLLAAVDARWDHFSDAAGLDTIVSRSTDNGETWSYSFANFFNDSTNAYNARATAFIDPLMISDKDDTVYLLVDLFPGGIALGGATAQPDASTGYVDVDSTLRLALYTSNEGQTDSNYAYYVGEFEEDGFAPVYPKGNSINAAYYVDQYYYLYDSEKHPKYCAQLGSDKQVEQNVFFYNADLHVRRATYLWLVKSTDGGATWSVPTILNPQIRKTENPDKFYGVGPGAGLCLTDGTIVLPCYTHSDEISSFIYSADKGITWKRSENATPGDHWSSESALVQVDADTLRQFYRDGYNTLYYTDHTRVGDEWRAGSPVNTGVSKTAGNQLSAIRYSKTIDGKSAIMVSTADGSGRDRVNGKIYTFTLNEDNTMDLAYTYSVTKGSYGYSSLTELKDGSIGLLYEGNGIEYHRFPIEDIAAGGIIEGMPAIAVTAANTELIIGETAELTAQVVNAEADGLVWTNDNEAVVTMNGSGASATVTALAPGKATITAALTVDGRVFSGSIKVYVSDDGTVTLPDNYEDVLITKNDCYLLDDNGPDGGGKYAVVWPGCSGQTPRVLYHTGTGDTDQVTVSIDNPYLSINTGFDASRQLWTIQEVDSGYTLQSVDSGRYLSITEATNSKLHTSADASALVITPTEDGFYTIGSDVGGVMYYVHHADSGDQFNAAVEATGLALYQHADTVYTTSTVGLSALISKIEAESLNSSNYTSDTWAELADALTAAKKLAEEEPMISAVEADAVSRQAQIVAAAQALYTARRNLEQASYISGVVTTTKPVKVTNPDGSVTTTVTNKATGTVTATTKYPDGTVTVVETKKDGSVKASEKRPDGTQGTTTVSAGGVIKAEAKLSQKAVEAAAKAGEAVTLPVMSVKAGADADAAPEIKVSLPRGDSTVKVEVQVENATPGTVLVLMKEDGGKELLKTTVLTENGVAAALEGSAILKVVDNGKSFTDVAAVEGWAGDAIAFVAARELFGGVGGDRFAPTENMNRAMLVTVLARLDGQDTTGGDNWYAKSVAWSVEQGISDGTNMEAAVSREQLVTILYRYAGSPANTEAGLDNYADATQVSGWAQGAMLWAVKQGILTGKNGNLLDPAATATRAEVSTILMRFINQK